MCTTIESIKPKVGELSELHLDIVGCECSMMQVPMRDGTRLVITIPITNAGNKRDIITSNVLNYVTDGDEIRVETENSTYIFTK